MSYTIAPLSTLETYTLSSNLGGFSFKQFKRTYSGNYQFNFPLCLSAARGYQNKNFTDFYLTDNKKASDFYEIERDVLISDKILTTISQGEDYLNFSQIDPEPYLRHNRRNEIPNYGAAFFSTNNDQNSLFEIQFNDDGSCIISTIQNNVTYYLASDIDNNIFFISENLVQSSFTTNQPHIFQYMYQQNNIFLILFQNKPDGFYFIKKIGAKLQMVKVTDTNKQTAVDNKFTLSRKKYTEISTSVNNSFITYNNDNNSFDTTRSKFNLRNNFLLHQKSSFVDSKTDIIILKNQMIDNLDNFSSSNNLLSASSDNIFVDKFRDYTSIFSDIPSETTEDLELNYVIYNSSLRLKPGKTIFSTSSSMGPFINLNINDSKLIESGSFAFESPMFSDKVYYYDDNINFNNHQHYLCTWLSGSPLSDNNIWVDRYYYPDLISKENALAGKAEFPSTYDQYIENLINSNISTLETPIKNVKFFDKISDLSFKPNSTYIYDRIQSSNFDFVQSTIGYCNGFSSTYPINYYKQINTSGKFTFGIYFSGNSSEWILESDRNNINAGVKLTKTSSTLEINYNLYDSSLNQYKIYTKTVSFKQLKENFVCVAFDSLTGEGYFMFNNDIILNFNEKPAQFSKKRILFGDFFVIQNDKKTNVLNYTNSDITGTFIADKFYNKNLIYVISVLNGKTEIDDIIISLPCGMRNNSDTIKLLHNICGNTVAKSNKFNTYIKNIHVPHQNILKDLENILNINITDQLPVNSDVNNLNFENYK